MSSFSENDNRKMKDKQKNKDSISTSNYRKSPSGYAVDRPVGHNSHAGTDGTLSDGTVMDPNIIR